jgi:hypothetical protein
MKKQILTKYLSNLETLYAGKVDYSEGSRPRTMAIDAARSALAGKLKLEGQAWEAAVREVTGMKCWTCANLANLPE